MDAIPDTAQVAASEMSIVEGLMDQMRAFFKSPTYGDLDSEPEQRAPSGRRLTGGRDRKPSGTDFSGGSAASPALPSKRGFPFLALLAALAIGLLFLLPGGLLQAQQTADTYYHDENDPEPVVTLAAVDLEGVTPIYWSFFSETGDTYQDLPGGNVGPEAADIEEADFANNNFFDVEGGVLSFMTAPNYEAPVDEGTDNNYKMVVQASDGGGTTWVQYFKVTVNVLDVEETGSVAWTVDPDGSGDEAAGQELLEFQAGAILRATVTDPDGPATIVPATTAWRWYRSQSNTGPWTIISDEQGVPVSTTNTYTVSDTANDDDVGMYLRATANYEDRLGTEETAAFVSAHRVSTTVAD